MSRYLLIVLACGSAWAASPSGAQLARSIREAGLDPEACYRVRDLSFQKEDIRIYLSDGYLIFSKPVAGEPRSALFSAEVEGGDGEVILLPPYRGERQSLARFTQSANLDEHFQTALMVFTDDLGRTLLDRIQKEGAGRKVSEIGRLLTDKWSPVLANVALGFEMRLVNDLLAPGPEPGMLFLALSGRQAGNFDILFDPYSYEQITAGQLTERGGRLRYNIWTSFASRSRRTGSAKAPENPFSLANFRIDAALDADLRMKATTRVRVDVGEHPVRAFSFKISRSMRVTAARIDGAPAELLFHESLRGQALRGDENEGFLVLAPEALAGRTQHEFEFEHDGAVVASAGRGVYYVRARSTWYPRGGDAFASYDLTFRYPKRLTLVTAGDPVEDRTDGDWRITRRRTPVPIREAGFNLGDYEKVLGTVPGFTVEIYGNRHLEAALQPKPREIPQLVEPRMPTRGRYPRNNNVVTIPEVLVPPDPLARLHAVAANVSSALELFSGYFGPPALKTLTVAPIPGTFGEGFPGLVYLSTLSYLDSTDLPAPLRNRQQQLFFSDLIEAHEVAHQWWGNVVIPVSYQDDWLMEALSNYSALLWLEKTKGTKALETVLDDYRDHLLNKDSDGRTVESAGPIVWGQRLDSAGIPDAWRSITYEKGAWIMHMLRRRLGDERFLKMLAELRRRHEFHYLSTEDFRALAKEFRPPRTTVTSIDEFFDNWVYSAGVPALKLRFAVKGDAPAVKLTGTVAQSGVDDEFSVEVPVEIQFAKGAAQTIWVRTSNEDASFSTTLRQVPLRVTMPGSGVLTAKK